MRKDNVFKRVRIVIPFLTILVVVYVIATACGGGYGYPTAGGWSGILWVNTFPPVGRLHIHAHCTMPDVSSADTLPMNEDSIPLSFSQWQSHNRIDGIDYYRKYHSSYGTTRSIYAA